MRRQATVLLFAALCACADGGATRGESVTPWWDGGPPDAGAPAARDAGTTPETDAATPSDAGDSADPGDAAPDAGAVCDPTWLPPPEDVLPRCERSTWECLDACPPSADSSECINGCLAADAHPPTTFMGAPFDCRQCLAHQQMACLDDEGCHEPLATLTCCAEDACGGLDAACMSTHCATELADLQACADVATPCSDFGGEDFAPCFQPEGT